MAREVDAASERHRAAGSHLSSKLPLPYADVRLLPERQFPWFSAQKRSTLERLLLSRGDAPADRTILEIGSWVGDSARFFGMRARRVFAVDTWAGPVDTHHYILPNLYQQFLSNIVHAGLTDVVVPVRMASLEAVMALDVRPDVIYVDGDHSARAAYLDTVSWARRLAPGGLLCGDDYTWHTVQDGVHQAAEDLGLDVQAEGDTWWLVDRQST